MLRPVVFVLLALAAAVPAGCGKPSPSAVGGSGRSPSVSYEARGEGGAVVKGVTESGSFSVGKNTLELKGGRVYANGKDHGPVKEGDSVLLDADGQVSVNGEKRMPE